jgi:hypothetical protein
MILLGQCGLLEYLCVSLSKWMYALVSLAVTGRNLFLKYSVQMD